MSQRSTLRGLFGSRASAASLAAIAALVLVVALPAPVFAWSNDTFSATDEDTFVTLINQFRASNGLPALIVDSTVRQAARQRSQDMYNTNCFSHDCNNDGVADGFHDLKVDGYCFSSAGENIAWNNYPDSKATQTAFDGWKNETPPNDSHRKIMLGSYTRIGIGAYKGDGRWAGKGGAYGSELKSYPAHVFTALFTVPCGSATPKPTPTATPKPTPTPTPRPTASPAPTPRPTATPTPRPSTSATASPRPTPTPKPTPTDPGATPPDGSTPTPGPTVDPSPNPSPDASLDPSAPPVTTVFTGPFDATGDLAGNPHNWLGGGERSGANPAPSPEPSVVPADTPPPIAPGDGTSLQVVEPLPAVDLLDAVVSGVAGTYFGH